MISNSLYQSSLSLIMFTTSLQKQNKHFFSTTIKTDCVNFDTIKQKCIINY